MRTATGSFSAVLALWAVALCPGARAQTPALVARAASVSGRVMISTAGAASWALTRGYALNPGDRLDTHGGGRLVVELSDGSVIVVEPETVLVIKDFRAAISIRELFDIAMGAVRVRINHFAGRPNPYRMNSPTASIAVRGTEFSVAVDTGGDTEVLVFDGAVEVTSLSDPSRTALVGAGRGVLVAPGQNLRMFSAPVGRNGAGTRERENSQPPRSDGDREFARSDAPPPRAGNHAPAPHPERSQSQGPPAGDGHASASHGDNSTAASTPLSTYDRYIAGLTNAGRIPFLDRYGAIPDAHLDSLENPAYAAGFHSAESRILLLPAFSGSSAIEQAAATPGPAGSLPASYSISPQFSVFTPLPGGNFVVGGALAASRLGGLALGSASTSTFLSGSVIAAVRFGAGGSDSFGLKFDRIRGTGAAAPDSGVFETKWTAGFAREFAATQKAGVFFSYSQLSGNTMNAAAGGHTMEAGFRLRGTITPWLFYGLTGDWAGLSLRGTGENGGAQRGSLAVGLGYMPNRHTLLTLDVAGAAEKGRTERLDTGAASVHERFLSVHGAAQFDITRRLFGTISFMVLGQSRHFGPDELPFALAAAYPLGRRFSDFGIGWRFSSDLFVQYIYGTSYGYTAATQAILLRYTFHFRGQ